ncbi:bifunctional 6-phosphofructo-2-kinase/fructose-2,6-bisphosphate 2-phosphatase [Terfezia boudieri ATCC MYA-4762]|uniref:Bifunctional 6-phosphofructo-2-kinase/fructose-2,6-bisphosphate 2-phosphatase n=1 Tax=Terfezia boudieri ATCC MYA-4762 TaxID=1051890 RepID=A0A3N4LXG7_9PEZI|nr:bifunctional 6-phosphofructo-2-kinase/fructose-2,6-bisphosphate 2-phosphatase [Terfezia boudieri ATCC MYA-4762]
MASPPPSPSPHINPIHPLQRAGHSTPLAYTLPTKGPTNSPIPVPPSHLPAPFLPTNTSNVSRNLAGTQIPVTCTPPTPPALTYTPTWTSPPTTPAGTIAPRKQAQHSSIAKSVMTAPAMSRSSSAGGALQTNGYLLPPGTDSKNKAVGSGGVGVALSDTPDTTAPNSPKLRATTLDIPGLTKSRISPDGRIASRDIGAKLVIVMVGLPARGKSYVTRKIARYLNWLQHNTKIFNVGARRRIAAGVDADAAQPAPPKTPPPASLTNGISGTGLLPADRLTALLEHTQERQENPNGTHGHGMDQSSDFFDPNNLPAKQLREKVAMETLDELLNYILYEGGSVGILDATNSTQERRRAIVNRIRQQAGPELGIVFLESECKDEKLLEANMRLKLSGPDYKGMDPVLALEDFKKRVKIYEENYTPLGDYEEQMNWQYIKMVDVGRKVVAHQIRGFLAGQTVYYLLNFNLAPRQIWITRHGESMDNLEGRIGGDAHLSADGDKYAKALTRFIDQQRTAFNVKMQEKYESSLLPPRPGDITPPNPEYTVPGDDPNAGPVAKNFCVWTSMLNRSIETAKYFDEEEYDIKEMRMLNELSAGIAEGMTYEEIRTKYPEEYAARRKDKLHYRYPGAGGESYLDVINRLRAVIVEVERMTDHVLLVGHRVVARVLLAYFLGLDRDDVACLDVPLGMLYVLEPKPYGVGFQAYQYNPTTDWFDELPNYKVKREEHPHPH